MALETIEGGSLSETDAVTNNLLASVPRGEVIKDPREGNHDARLLANELVQNKSGTFAILTEFTDMTDNEGRDFSSKARYNIPEPNSSEVQKRIFLSELHTLGVIPREDRQAVYCDSDETRQALLTAFNAKVGEVFQVNIQDDKGFPRLKVLRAKK